MPPEATEDGQRRFRAFVSYSRRDSAFADRLVPALEQRGLAVTIDTRDLPYGEKWQHELAGFIASADGIVFLVSPGSVDSHWCKWEVAQVTAQSKRLVPVLIEPVPVERLPPEVREVHLFPCTAELDFETRVEALARVLVSDRAWVQEHTRLADIAGVWAAHGRASDRLLVGHALSDAERWLLRRPADAPAPSQFHLDFIAASQIAAKARARRWVIGLSAVAIGAVALATIALMQRQSAVANRDLATGNEARAMAELSRAENARGDATRALSLALDAYDTAATMGLENDDAETALYEALWRMREVRRTTLDFDATYGWFDPATGQIKAASDERLVVLDRQLQKLSDASPPRQVGDEIRSPDKLWGLTVPRPKAVEFSWSPTRATFTFRLPAQNGGEWTVPSSALPFPPQAAWLIVPSENEDGGLIIERRRPDDFAHSESIAFIRPGTTARARSTPSVESTVVPVAGFEYEIDPSGQLVVLGRGWGSAYYVRSRDPEVQVQLHAYIRATDLTFFSRYLRYSPKERILSYVGSGDGSDIEQPILMDFATGVRMATLGGHTARVAALDLAPDQEQILTLTDDRVLRLMRLRVQADRRLVEQHGGTLLSGRYAGAPVASQASFLPITDGPVFRALMRDRGPLGNRWFDHTLYGVKGHDEVIALGRDELSAWLPRDLTTPVFRASLAGEPSRVLSDDDATLLISDTSGGIVRWSRTGVVLARLLQRSPEPILWMEFTSSDRDVIRVVTPRRVFDLPVRDGTPTPVASLPGTIVPTWARLSGDWLSYCAPDEATYVYRCELFSLATRSVLLKLSCDGQVAVDGQLNIAYCDRGSGMIPKVYDLGDTSRTIVVFPDEQTVSASGLSLQATIEHTAIESCRRAFINLGGGNPDVPYRGEGLLYDFARRREIARTTGDPGTAFTDYGGGRGLPVFCNAKAVAEYARALLTDIGIARPEDSR